MKKTDKDHPEVKDIKNICEISSNTKTTKEVCDVLHQHKMTHHQHRQDNQAGEDSANPGNQYTKKNQKPGQIEKKGFNNAPTRVNK